MARIRRTPHATAASSRPKRTPRARETTTTTTTTTNPFTRKRKTTKKTTTTGGARAPATHHRRKPTLGDKVEGALEKVKGTILRKPGVKGAGTKKMRGTDGKGSHHVTV